MTTATVGLAAPSQAELTPLYKRITFHLLPYIYICYLFNYFDRVNVGFAKLQMLDDLHLSETDYGLAAGIFFLGYVVFGIPSNLMMRKVGARRWIALLLVLWGAFSVSLMFVTSATTFCVLRFLTGAAEAGFFPGIVLFFNGWYPSARRGRIMALFMSAIPLSGLIGSPLSGWIMQHFSTGQGGIAGWQWLYLLEGLPTIILGVGVLFFLSDGISQAGWLAERERTVLQDAIAEDEKSKAGIAADSFASVLRNPQVWIAGIIYFCIQSGVYAINFWLPSIVKASGFQSPEVIGWISAIPYLAASVFMVVVGRSADVRRERRYHLAVPMLMGVVGLVIAANFTSNPVIATLGLTLATMGALTGLPMFWPLSGSFLTPAAAAGGLALMNSLGQIAGFCSPYLVGWIKDTTHSTDLALYILAAVMLLGVILVLRIPAKTVNR